MLGLASNCQTAIMEVIFLFIVIVNSQINQYNLVKMTTAKKLTSINNKEMQEDGDLMFISHNRSMSFKVVQTCKAFQEY